MELNGDSVWKLIMRCLYTDEEIEAWAPGFVPSDTIIAKGIVSVFGFHPGRLEEAREEVLSLLRQLPEAFRTGGWWFGNMVTNAKGEQWTDFQYRADELLCLAIGLKIGQIQIPRDDWSMFPGGLPYVAFEV